MQHLIIEGKYDLLQNINAFDCYCKIRYFHFNNEQVILLSFLYKLNEII